MGSALTSSNAPRTSQRMRTRPERRRLDRDGRETAIANTNFRRADGKRVAGPRYRRRASATSSKVLGQAAEVLFRAERTLHDRANGVTRGIPEVENAVDLLSDGQIDAMVAGEREQS